jgi:hypothetical protein
MSDPVLIEISLGHNNEPATEAENEVLTECSSPLQTG